jgi:hypothetical protein
LEGAKIRAEGAREAAKEAIRNARPPVHMIKLTETRKIAPYVWVHPDG